MIENGALVGDVEYRPITLHLKGGYRSVFEVRIGDAIIGVIYFHRCGEWVFVAYDPFLPLRSDTMAKIAKITKYVADYDWTMREKENSTVGEWMSHKYRCL